MLLNTEHLQPGMVLERDIELSAGSYLITRNDLSEGRLDEKVIEAIRKFGNQIVPQSDRVCVRDDKQVLEQAKGILRDNLEEIAEGILSGKSYPNFLRGEGMEQKVMRVMDILLSNPDIVRTMYDARYNSSGKKDAVSLVLDHSVRTTLLAVALGLRMKLTIISLISLGTASLLHDLGMIAEAPEGGLEALDDLSGPELLQFVRQHQQTSASLFARSDMVMSPYHETEVFHIISKHHLPNLDDEDHRNSMIFHFADLVDEMISLMPFRVRYNFSRRQLDIIGDSYRTRTSIMPLMSALIKLHRGRTGLVRVIIRELAGLFRMEQLLRGDYDIKLREILDQCPYDSSAAWPDPGGDKIPHTVYCRKSLDRKFFCEHLIYQSAGVKDENGQMQDYLKCGLLGPLLEKLNREGGD